MSTRARVIVREIVAAGMVMAATLAAFTVVSAVVNG